MKQCVGNNVICINRNDQYALSWTSLGATEGEIFNGAAAPWPPFEPPLEWVGYLLYNSTRDSTKIKGAFTHTLRCAFLFIITVADLLKRVLIGHWLTAQQCWRPRQPWAAGTLLGESVTDILMAVGAYRVVHSHHTSLFYNNPMLGLHLRLRFARSPWFPS